MDRQVPIVRAVSSGELFSRSTAAARFRAATVGFFALGGLAVSALGIFGLLSYWSRLKSHELGIRLALGAQPRDLAKHVLWQGIKTVSAGMVVGLALCLAGGRLLQSQLYGVGSNDLPTLLSGILLIGLITLVASYSPARRAARLDPKQTLRVT
ncbi:MAG: FtsX-like permease family protein [Acidobacteriota bacterium]